MSSIMPKSFSLPQEPQVNVKFRQFPKLPTEIRLMIWHVMFPAGRHLQLDLPGYQPPEDDREIVMASIPVTLHINSESRAETLKHYAVAFRRDVLPELKGKEIPFCFNPSIDTLYIDYNSLDVWNPTRRNHLRWLDHIVKQLPGGLNSIRYLEIRDDEYALATDSMMFDSPKRPARNTPLIKFVSSLGGLKEVCFSVASFDIDDDRFNELKHTVLALLKVREAYEGKEIPVVTVRNWEEVSTEAEM